MRRVIAVIVAAFALFFAGGMGLASAQPATSSTVTATQLIGYQNSSTATATVTTVVNKNWTITNGTLVVQAAPGHGYEGWVDTFTYTKKVSVADGSTTFTGTVTLVTPYASDTRSLTFDTTSAMPFEVIDGSIALDVHSMAGQAYYAAEVDMAYPPNNLPLVNAWFWFV